MSRSPLAAGKSSFDLIDSERLFAELELKKDLVLLDVACGRGAYTLAAAERLGPAAKIYAVDLWREGVEALREAGASRGLHTIEAAVADAGKKLPVPAAAVDLCLLATVLHDFIVERIDDRVLHEVGRVLKPAGVLAVVEFKKIDGPPGPPIEIRLAPAELEERLRPHAFRLVRSVDVGPYNYLSLFARG